MLGSSRACGGARRSSRRQGTEHRHGAANRVHGPGRGWAHRQEAYRESGAWEHRDEECGAGREGRRRGTAGSPTRARASPVRGVGWLGGWRSPRYTGSKMRNSGRPPRRIGTAGKRGNAPLRGKRSRLAAFAFWRLAGKRPTYFVATRPFKWTYFIEYLWTKQPQQDQVGWVGATCAPRKARGVSSRCWSCRCRLPAGSSALLRPQRLRCRGFLGGGRVAGVKWALAAPSACIAGVVRTAAAPLPRLCSWVCPRPTAWRRPRRR